MCLCICISYSQAINSRLLNAVEHANNSASNAQIQQASKHKHRTVKELAVRPAQLTDRTARRQENRRSSTFHRTSVSITPAEGVNSNEWPLHNNLMLSFKTVSDGNMDIDVHTSFGGSIAEDTMMGHALNSGRYDAQVLAYVQNNPSLVNTITNNVINGNIQNTRQPIEYTIKQFNNLDEWKSHAGVEEEADETAVAEETLVTYENPSALFESLGLPPASAPGP